METDVLIVGGGITGILTAYALASAGVKSVVLEADRIGFGATGKTTAFITQILDMSLVDMERLMGAERTTELWNAGSSAIDLIERIVWKEKIDCGFQRCPAFLFATTDKELARLEDEERAAGRLGFSVSLRRDGALGFPNVGYLEVPDQAKFDAIKFLRAVARKAERLGAQIIENSAVLEIKGKHAFVARTSAMRVRAKRVVIATSVPITKPKIVAFKKANYKSYVLEAEIPKGSLREGMYVDARNPYHYFRVDAGAGADRLILGGADHRQDIPVSEAKSYERLERFLPTILPGVQYRIVRRWSGPLVESIDGLPYIGEYSPCQYLATAFSGSGMIYAPIAAEIFRDDILGKPNSWSRLYDPKRSQPISLVLTNARHYVGEFFGGAVATTFS